MTRTIVSIGGAPSSGSTLLADLLDSVPGFVCPPELYCLCFPEAYKFDDGFRQNAPGATQLFDSGCCYAAPRPWFNRKHFAMCGLDDRAFVDMTQSASTIQDFVATLSDHIGEHLGRSVDVFCEKTPINVVTAARFCADFPTGWFVHIVRDGRSVVASLIARGYGIYEAVLIWLQQVHLGLSAKDCENYIQLKFEDLVQAPYDQAAQLAKKFGQSTDAQTICEAFAANSYRASICRPKSWSVPEFTGQIQPVTEPDAALSETDEAFVSGLALFEVASGETPKPVISFRQAMKACGYASPPHADMPVSKDAFEQVFSHYLRYSKNLTRQSSLRLYPDGLRGADEFFAYEVSGMKTAVAELERLRWKITKMTRSEGE